MPVFISYVREDVRYADFLAGILRENGIDVWLDRNEIRPGERWKDAIRNAISAGDYFLALFSKNHTERKISYANEELLQAVELLRKMPRNRAWLIPVRVDDCNVPEIPIGASETLRDLNWVSLGDDYTSNLERLLRALGVDNPITGFGLPLAAGYGHHFDIVGGEIVYDDCSLSIPMLKGLVFHITGGWCTRQPDGKIIAQIITGAPHKDIDEINTLLGFNRMLATTDSDTISIDIQNPCIFNSKREFHIPKNTPLPDFSTGKAVSFPLDLPVSTFSLAEGALQDGEFVGQFSAYFTYQFPGRKLDVTMTGSVRIRTKS